MIVAAVVVLVGATAPIPRAARIGSIALAFAWLVGPVAATAAGALIVTVAALHRMAVRARADDRDASEELLAIDLIALGVGGGLSFAQAVTVAASTVSGPSARRLRVLQRRLIAGSDVPVGEGTLAEVVRIAERSAASGAALGPGLRAVAASVRNEHAAADRARLARLPVRLLFPLALLILPGFILLAVGPTVLSGLSRLAL